MTLCLMTLEVKVKAPTIRSRGVVVVLFPWAFGSRVMEVDVYSFLTIFEHLLLESLTELLASKTEEKSLLLKLLSQTLKPSKPSRKPFGLLLLLRLRRT